MNKQSKFFKATIMAVCFSMVIGLGMKPKRAEALIPVTDIIAIIQAITSMVVELVNLFESITEMIETVDQGIMQAKSLLSLPMDYINKVDGLVNDVAGNTLQILDKLGDPYPDAPASLAEALGGYLNSNLDEMYAMGKSEFPGALRTSLEDALYAPAPKTVEEVDTMVADANSDPNSTIKYSDEAAQVMKANSAAYTQRVEPVAMFIGGQAAQVEAKKQALDDIKKKINVNNATWENPDTGETEANPEAKIQIQQADAMLKSQAVAEMMGGVLPALLASLDLESKREFAASAINAENRDKGQAAVAYTLQNPPSVKYCPSSGGTC